MSAAHQVDKVPVSAPKIDKSARSGWRDLKLRRKAGDLKKPDNGPARLTEDQLAAAVTMPSERHDKYSKARRIYERHVGKINAECRPGVDRSQGLIERLGRMRIDLPFGDDKQTVLGSPQVECLGASHR